MINQVTSSGMAPPAISASGKEAGQQPAATPPQPAAGSVALSGHALMLSRLFGQEASTYTGQVKTGRNADNGELVPYLTRDDRAMLERMYDYSVAHGIDLQHVDALGSDLAMYRRFGASNPVGVIYDTEGHAQTYDFSASNKVLAQRIADNSATSTLDLGFLQSELVAGTHSANFAFLARMTEVFSTRAAGGIPAASQAPIAAYSREANRLDVAVSRDVQLVIPEADYSSVDGVGHWRTPELEAAHNAKYGLGQKGGGIAALLAGGDATVRDFLKLLDGYARQGLHLSNTKPE